MVQDLSTVEKAVESVIDKYHQSQNLLEKYLVSDKEMEILKKVIPSRHQTSKKMTLRNALYAFNEFQNVSILRL